MSTTTELKPCPFCGEQPNFVHSTYESSVDDPIRDYVRGECNCGISTDDRDYNTRRWGKPIPDGTMQKAAERSAAEYWNRRAVPERSIGTTAAQGEPSIVDNVVKEAMQVLERSLQADGYLPANVAQQSKAGSAEQVSEREAFEHAMAEAIIADQGEFAMSRAYDADQSYTFLATKWAWAAWQARAALQHTAPAPSNPAMEGAILDALAHGTGIVRIDPLSIFQQGEQTATSKAGEWTDEQILAAAVRFGIGAMPVLRGHWQEHGSADQRIVAFARALLSAPAQAQSEDARDAARYRWLRQQHWAKAALCVVTNPKDAVKLGRDCPSLDRLDAAIDSAMSTQSEKDGGK